MNPKAKRCKMSNHQDQENALVAGNSEFHLLPELLRMILAKAVLVQMYSEDSAKRQRDQTIFIGLASVAFHWFRSLKTRYLKNRIRHFSKVYFQRPKMRSTIIRNNRNFLKEVINPDETIFRLESCGCLTEDQVTFLKRLRNRKDKNHELLLMLQDCSSQKYSKFVDCLFSTNQTPAALVLERGGEAVKVHINCGKAASTREFEMELIERFQRMQTENTLMLDDLLNAAVEERLNDVFILRAKQNKGIELWFWCKTKRSSSQLKGLSDDDLREIIQRMYQRLIPEHSTSLEPQLIQMEYCLASDFAERRLCIRHVGDREHLNKFEFSRRFEVSQLVTSLADKIYVVQKEGEISVYWNKYPYRSLKSIVLNHDCLPIQIASCNVNNCLYMSANEHILKVEPMLDNRVSEWRYVTGLLFISVTSRGDVLVLKNGIGYNDLQIITHQRTVKRTIPVQYRFSDFEFIQEIMPDIVALSYKNWFRHGSNCITIMRLDENGTVLRNIDWHETIVIGLSSFRYGDLVIGVFEHRNVSGALPLRSNDHHCVKLQHWTLESNVARDLLTTDEQIVSIHFDADQRQLYVLSRYKLKVYHFHYEDEVYN